jgi:excisionase family DNA binding protein
MENEMLSISEAARLMGVHENTLRDWDIENKFKASRTVGGHRRYSLSDIRNYLDRMPAEALKEVGIIEEPKEKDPFKAIIQKWEEAGYLNELDNFTQKSILAAIGLLKTPNFIFLPIRYFGLLSKAGYGQDSENLLVFNPCGVRQHSYTTFIMLMILSI